MRCTRCDRLAIPQAVGHTPDGRIVFGWCLACLDEARCTRIEVARRSRGRGRAGLLIGVNGAAAGASGSDRRQMVTLIAGLLGVWSLVLCGTGVLLLVRPRSAAPSPLRNGTPIFFLVGGGTSAATCLLLWGLTRGAGVLRSRSSLRRIHWAAFVLALMILIAGIVRHVPRHDPWVIVAAGLVLLLSALARWRERRLPGEGAASG